MWKTKATSLLHGGIQGRPWRGRLLQRLSGKWKMLKLLCHQLVIVLYHPLGTHSALPHKACAARNRSGVLTIKYVTVQLVVNRLLSNWSADFSLLDDSLWFSSGVMSCLFLYHKHPFPIIMKQLLVCEQLCAQCPGRHASSQTDPCLPGHGDFTTEIEYLEGGLAPFS